MTAPDAYVLPFKASFDAPLGAVLECLDTRGWRYHDPRTDAEVIFHDHQANSYARTTGGVVGSLCVIVDIDALPEGSAVLVASSPA